MLSESTSTYQASRSAPAETVAKSAVISPRSSDAATVVSDYTALMSGFTWWGQGAPSGKGTFLTYSFETSVPTDYDASQSSAFYASFQAFSNAAKDAARVAINAWASISGITAFEAPSGQGDIAFLSFNLALNNDPTLATAAGYANYPYVYVYSNAEFTGRSFVSIDDNSLPTSNSQLHILLHEIGHAIGLKHPFDGNPTLTTALDNTDYTAMSYTFGSFAGTNVLGSLDIDAVHALYGDNSHDGTQVASWSWDSATYTLTQTGFDTAEFLRGVGSSDIMSALGGDDTILGMTGNDRLDGGDGNDFIGGGPGQDTMLGGNGNDLLLGDAGNDSIDGGVGNDSLRGDAGDDSIAGGSGNDTLDGGDGVDSLYGGAGADLYFVDNAGEVVDETANQAVDDGATDQISASVSYTLAAYVENLYLSGSGDTNATGNALANSMSGNAGNNLMNGGDGNDTIFAYGGNDSGDGGAGNDYLYGDAGDDSFVGGSGNDTLAGVDGNDYLDGGAGNDWDQGGAGNDQLYGADGTDQLHGDTGNDLLVAGFGDDGLYGEDGNDTLFGEFGNDLLISGYGDDQLYGQDGTDTLYGEIGNDILSGGTGNDLLYGQAGADIIRGEDGNDSLFGGADNDQLSGGFGSDALYSEDGNDVLFGEGGDDQLIAGNGDDRLYGQDGNDLLKGEAGNDILDGGIGGDFLVGGAGTDQLTGGAGADVFYYDTPLEPADFIADFSHAEGDRLVFQGSAFHIPAGFTLTTGVGLLQGAGVHPVAATATFYLDTTTKALWFDPDGTGAGEAHVIAFLLNTPTLNTGDFLFV